MKIFKEPRETRTAAEIKETKRSFQSNMHEYNLPQHYAFLLAMHHNHFQR